MTGRGGVDFAAFEVRIGWQRPLEPTQDGKKNKKNKKQTRAIRKVHLSAREPEQERAERHPMIHR